MSKLYCIVHKDDATWMHGDEYCSATWHAVKHQFYDLDAAKECVNYGPKQYVLLGTTIVDGKRIYDGRLIETKIPA